MRLSIKFVTGLRSPVYRSAKLSASALAIHDLLRRCNPRKGRVQMRLLIEGAPGVAFPSKRHQRVRGRRYGSTSCPSLYNANENENDEMAGDGVPNWECRCYRRIFHLDSCDLLLNQRNQKVRVMSWPGAIFKQLLIPRGFRMSLTHSRQVIIPTL